MRFHHRQSLKMMPTSEMERGEARGGGEKRKKELKTTDSQSTVEKTVDEELEFYFISFILFYFKETLPCHPLGPDCISYYCITFYRLNGSKISRIFQLKRKPEVGQKFVAPLQL